MLLFQGPYHSGYLRQTSLSKNWWSLADKYKVLIKDLCLVTVHEKISYIVCVLLLGTQSYFTVNCSVDKYITEMQDSPC